MSYPYTMQEFNGKHELLKALMKELRSRGCDRDILRGLAEVNKFIWEGALKCALEKDGEGNYVNQEGS